MKINTKVVAELKQVKSDYEIAFKKYARFILGFYESLDSYVIPIFEEVTNKYFEDQKPVYIKRKLPSIFFDSECEGQIFPLSLEEAKKSIAGIKEIIKSNPSSYLDWVVTIGEVQWQLCQAEYKSRAYGFVTKKDLFSIYFAINEEGEIVINTDIQYRQEELSELISTDDFDQLCEDIFEKLEELYSMGYLSEFDMLPIVFAINQLHHY